MEDILLLTENGALKTGTGNWMVKLLTLKTRLRWKQTIFIAGGWRRLAYKRKETTITDKCGGLERKRIWKEWTPLLINTWSEGFSFTPELLQSISTKANHRSEAKKCLTIFENSCLTVEHIEPPERNEVLATHYAIIARGFNQKANEQGSYF